MSEARDKDLALLIQDYEEQQHETGEDAAEALRKLAGNLSTFFFYNGPSASSSTLDAGHHLADYRRAASAAQGETLSAWPDDPILFYFTAVNAKNVRSYFLGTEYELLEPGTPFRDGNLLCFSREHWVFEDLDGKITTTPIDLPNDSMNPTDTASYVSCNAARETHVYSRLAAFMGRASVFGGNPQPLKGEFFSEEGCPLLETICSEKGYIFALDDKRVGIYDSPKSRELLEGKNLVSTDCKDTVGSTISLAGELIKGHAGRLSTSYKDALAYARQITADSLREEPGLQVSDEDLQDFLERRLSWFSYDSDDQKAAAFKNIGKGFRRQAWGFGRKAKRAQRFETLMNNALLTAS